MHKLKTEIPNTKPISKRKPPEKPPNILVIDDDRVILDLFDKVFKKLGFKVLLTSDGKNSVDLVKRTGPDVILLDIKMPGMDGITALREIKTVDQDVEVIIMTGYASLDSALEAIKQGAFDYLEKPFARLDQVVNAVWRAWERRRPKMERLNVKASLERKVYELKHIYNASRSLVHCSDRREMMIQLLESLSKIVEYDLAVMILADKPDQKQLLLQVVNSSTSHIVEEAKFNLIDAFNSVSPTRIFHSVNFDEIISGENISQEEPGGKKIAYDLNSFLNIPLMDGGKIIGMVNLSSRRDISFSSDDIRLIYSMVSQLPPVLQKLSGIKSAERIRLAKLTQSMSEGVVIVDENFEVASANPAAQTILCKENPDAEHVQNSLELDLEKLKAHMDKEQLDLVKKEATILAQNYEVAVSLMKGTTEGFIGFAIFIRPFLEGKRD
jgi:CheY-like chemotaxis protein